MSAMEQKPLEQTGTAGIGTAGTGTAETGAVETGAVEAGTGETGTVGRGTNGGTKSFNFNSHCPNDDEGKKFPSGIQFFLCGRNVCQAVWLNPSVG